MLALVKNSSIITTIEEGSALNVPGPNNTTLYVSPAFAGWEHEGYRLVKVPAKPAVPNGKQEVSAELKLVNSVLTWSVEYELIPKAVPEIISDRQFFQQLAVAGLVTQAEALAAVSTGAIPAAMEAFIVQLPESEQFAARMLLQGATTFQRSHPLTAAFGALYGMSPAQIDDLWIAASIL